MNQFAMEDQIELLEAAIADTNRRLEASERRNAQQVEAFAREINAIKDRLEAMDESAQGASRLSREDAK